MALSYLRLQGFVKQIGKCSKTLNYFSGQIGRSCSTTSVFRAEMSDLNDQNLEADSNVSPAIPVLETDPRSGNRKSTYKKKLHQRVLTVSEREEEKKWQEASLGFEASDSFGDLWRGKQRDIQSVKGAESSQGKISKIRQKNHAKRMFDEGRQSKKKRNTFEMLSDNPAQRVFDESQQSKREGNTFGMLSDDPAQRVFDESQQSKREGNTFGMLSDNPTQRVFDESQQSKREGNTFGMLSDNPAQRVFDESQRSKKEGNTFGMLSDNHAKRMFDESRQSKKERNTFGMLSDNRPLQRLVEDVDDKSFADDEFDAKDRTHIRLSKIGRFKEPHWYAKQINNLGKEGKVLEAIDMLEECMLKRDRVMPTTYVFNQLFGILGKVGYTKKAFQLFNKMKKMSIQPDGHTYTCLFNSCSNSPWPQDGLQRTINLHQLIKDKNDSLHPITYKAMVKAYGMCGDIQAAFQAADEMCKMHRPDQQLYSFLLMACVSDQQAGLKHALKVWKLMRQMRITPDLPLYNLFLRVIRDSGLGTDEDIKKFPKSRNLQPKEITKGRGNQYLHSEAEETNKEFLNETQMKSSPSAVSIEVRESDVSDVIDSAASLFGGTPVSALVDLSYPENRLAALGGPFPILEDMKKNGVSPNVVTFTVIMDCLPQENEVESHFLEYMAAENAPRDIDFYNMLIRRRNRRNDYKEANEVLKYIADEDLFPNLRTFGCLAMGCTTLLRAKNLLRNIDEAGLEPNIEIFGLLVYKSYLDFEYKEALLGMLKRNNIYPNQMFLQHVETSIQSARKKILKMEHNETVGAYFKTERFKSSFENFMKHYPKWLKAIGFGHLEHPWEDFRHTTKEGKEES